MCGHVIHNDEVIFCAAFNDRIDHVIVKQNRIHCFRQCLEESEAAQLVMYVKANIALTVLICLIRIKASFRGSCMLT